MKSQNFKPIVLSLIALGGAFAASAANATVINLDVNGDGAKDLSFTNKVVFDFFTTDYSYQVKGLNGTTVSAGGPLAFGNMIGATTNFDSKNLLAAYTDDLFYSGAGCGPKHSSSGWCHTGSWNNGFSDVSGYLGFALANGDDTFYGWANISMTHDGAATILGTAVESCANTAIGAGSGAAGCASTDVPEPASLALLAAGFAGIGVMRRRRAAKR